MRAGVGFIPKSELPQSPVPPPPPHPHSRLCLPWPGAPGACLAQVHWNRDWGSREASGLCWTPEPQCGARLWLSGQSTHQKPLGSHPQHTQSGPGTHLPPSTRGARAGGSGVEGQPLLHKEFEEQKQTQCPPPGGGAGQDWALEGRISPQSF